MKITDETRRAIFEDYLNRTNKVEDLEQKYGVPRSARTRIAVEQGAPPPEKKLRQKEEREHGKNLPEVQKDD